MYCIKYFDNMQVNIKTNAIYNGKIMLFLYSFDSEETVDLI